MKERKGGKGQFRESGLLYPLFPLLLPLASYDGSKYTKERLRKTPRSYRSGSSACGFSALVARIVGLSISLDICICYDTKRCWRVTSREQSAGDAILLTHGRIGVNHLSARSNASMTSGLVTLLAKDGVGPCSLAKVRTPAMTCKLAVSTITFGKQNSPHPRI